MDKPLQGYYPLEPEMLLFCCCFYLCCFLIVLKDFIMLLFASLPCTLYSLLFALCSLLFALFSVLCTLFYPPRPVGTPPWKVGELWFVLGNCSLLFIDSLTLAPSGVDLRFTTFRRVVEGLPEK